jgi:hypothetical protein
VSTSAFFGGPQHCGGWSVAVVTVAANAVTTRVVHKPDDVVTDAEIVGGAAGEEMANEGMRTGWEIV